MRIQADVEKLRASASTMRTLTDDLSPLLLKLELGNVALEVVDFFIDSRLLSELDALVDSIRTRGRQLATDGESLAQRLDAFAERLETADGSYALSLLPPPFDKDDLFSDDHLDDIADAKIKGTDSPELNAAMETLLDPNASEAEIAAALKTMAAECGISEEEAAANFQRLQEYEARAREIAIQNGKKPPERLDLSKHPNFLGSQTSLLFGKVVGDALGMHPAFAALLSPTGGIVGSGNDAVGGSYWKNHPLGYHGAVHDAAGYLLNYQDMGTGYDYLGQEGHRDPGNPLTGQESGIDYWTKRMDGYDPNFQGAVDNATPDFLKDRGIRVPKGLTEAVEESLVRGGGTGMGEWVDINENIDRAGDALDAGKDWVLDGGRRAMGGVRDKASDIFSFD